MFFVGLHDREQRKEMIDMKKELELQGKKVDIRGNYLAVIEPDG